MTKMEEAGLTNKVNTLLVSDHGMAQMKNVTYLVKDFVDVNLIDTTKTIYGIVSNIYPKTAASVF